MTQYNSLNEKLSNSQLNKLKSAIKQKKKEKKKNWNSFEIIIKYVGNSDDKTNFPHELLLTNRQVANLRKAFANNSSNDIKLSRTQLSKMMQLVEFLTHSTKNRITFNKKCN